MHSYSYSRNSNTIDNIFNYKTSKNTNNFYQASWFNINGLVGPYVCMLVTGLVILIDDSCMWRQVYKYNYLSIQVNHKFPFICIMCRISSYITLHTLERCSSKASRPCNSVTCSCNLLLMPSLCCSCSLTDVNCSSCLETYNIPYNIIRDHNQRCNCVHVTDPNDPLTHRVIWI